MYDTFSYYELRVIVAASHDWKDIAFRDKCFKEREAFFNVEWKKAVERLVQDNYLGDDGQLLIKSKVLLGLIKE